MDILIHSSKTAARLPPYKMAVYKMAVYKLQLWFLDFMAPGLKGDRRNRCCILG